MVANFLTRVDGAAQELWVYAEDPQARMRPFKRELKTGMVSVPFDDYVCLRAILLSSKTSVSGGPCVYWEKFDRAIVKDNVLRQRLHRSLSSHGVIARDGQMYRLDLNALGELGFNLSDIKSGAPTDAVLAFLGQSRHDSAIEG